jgi:hypothetical protein
MTLNEITVSPAPIHVPEFAPLPKAGLCPFTGQSRSGLFRLEREGVIKLARLRKPGNVHGRTYVPVPQVIAALKRHMTFGRTTEGAVPA